MGFFKDLKNMKDTAAEHGGMPSWSEARRDISAVFDDRGERDILKSGTSAMAKVKGFTMPVQGDRFAMQVPLEIHPPSGQPYEINYVFNASRMQAPLSAGMEVPVKISTDDPQQVAVQWDALMADVAASGGAMNAAMEGLAAAGPDVGAQMSASLAAAGMSPTPMNTATPAPPPAPAAPKADAQSRLEQLKSFKDQGLIDDSEYEKKKADILADL
jgi:hypothetical protein